MATTEAHPLTGARALGDEHGDAVPPLEGGDVGVDLGGKLGKLGDAKPGQESANFYGGDKAWGAYAGHDMKWDEKDFGGEKWGAHAFDKGGLDDGHEFPFGSHHGRGGRWPNHDEHEPFLSKHGDKLNSAAFYIAVGCIAMGFIQWFINRFTDGIWPSERRLTKATRLRSQQYIAAKKHETESLLSKDHV
jgi:hypothetical protein